MNGRDLQVEVYSDVICPWCYVGKRRLERALRQVGDAVSARVVWRPFQLNPTMPKGGMDRATYLNAKFGRAEVYQEMEQRLLEAGTMEQIPFHFEGIVRTPNTAAAHRLIWHAGQQGKQDEVVEALFRAYFVEGRDIGTISVLVDCNTHL